MEPTPRELLRTGLIAGVVALAAATAFYGIHVATGARAFFTHDLGASDIWHLNLPFKHVYQEALADGRLPLWCPDIGTGFPLMAEGEVGALYPLNLLLYGLLGLAAAFGCSTLLHTALAGAFVSVFARDLGASREGSVVAGLVFSLCGFFVTHVKHPALFSAAVWVPLLLLLVGRSVQTRSARAVLGLAATTACMVLAGHPQIAYYALLVAAVHGVGCAVGLRARSGWSGAVRGLGFAAAAAVLGVALAAPQILLTAELNALGPRAQGMTFEDATEWTNDWEHLATFVTPGAFGDPGELLEEPLRHRETGRPILHPQTGEPLRILRGFKPGGESRTLFWEMTGYLGLLALALAGAAWMLAWKRRAVWGLSALLAFSILLSVGPNGGLFQVMWHTVPGFDSFRFPGRWLLFADLSLAVLAGLGFTCLLRARRLASIPHGAVIGAAVVCVVTFADVHHALGDHNPTIAADRWLSPPASVRLIRDRERASPAPFRIAHTDPTRPGFSNAYFRARGWQGDLSPYAVGHTMVAPNLNVLFGLNDLDGYTPIFPTYVAEGIRMAYADPAGFALPRGEVDLRTLSLFNVKYVFDAYGRAPPPLEFLVEYPGDISHRGGVIFDPPVPEEPPIRPVLSTNPRALPRAFLVPTAIVARGPDVLATTRARLGDGGFDPRRELVLTPIPGTPQPVTGPRENPNPIEAPVEFVSYAPDRVHLRTNTPRICWLFFSDTWYPGWTATVNEQPADIHCANLCGRALLLPAGPCEIVFRYEPAPLRNGWMTAAIALLLLAVLSWMARRSSAGARQLEP